MSLTSGMETPQVVLSVDPAPGFQVQSIICSRLSLSYSFINSNETIELYYENKY